MPNCSSYPLWAGATPWFLLNHFLGITEDLSIWGTLMPCSKYGHKFLKWYKIRLQHILFKCTKNLCIALSFFGNPYLIDVCIFSGYFPLYLVTFKSKYIEGVDSSNTKTIWFELNFLFLITQLCQYLGVGLLACRTGRKLSVVQATYSAEFSCGSPNKLIQELPGNLLKMHLLTQ